ncbi:MAG: hypothetical protein JO359_14540 [Candidatus Eremiobacteraeota bacterium]|nr:hypothetical protein [Candidatus Eremiobacteraeota bacterium]
MPRPQLALLVQGSYYAITGLWPLVSMRSFEAVTGPKVDRWLVKMVGLLALSNGLALLVGSRRERVSEETRVLAIASIFAFTAVDVVYAAKRRISPIYLADAVAELALLVVLLG